ncbi:hypothetical protein ACQ4PT_053545 [Festuca glaucescens]
MSSSSGRRSSPPALPVASSSGQKRARGDDDPGTSLSKPDSTPAPAQNPRRAFSSSPFADFGSYMSAKNSKLAAQFDADASTSAAAPGALFAGVSIFVDGFTVPSSQELKEIMLNNGGRLVNYFSRHTVTHIICTHLPESKMRNMRAFSKGLPVVKPAWVVDSLAENRILSSIPYQISHHSSSSRKQMKLSAFFSEKQDGIRNQGDRNDENKDLGFQTSSAQEGSQDQNVSREKEGSLMSVEVAEDSLSPDEHEVSTFEERDGEDFAMDEDDNACETAISESVDNDMDSELYVADSPDATSDVCGTNTVGSHLPLDDNVEEVTQRMRNEIFGTTKCTASAGIAENRLLARLATRSAKPNGQLFISSEKADDYLNTLPIKALPGIGFTVSTKLKSNEVEHCGQLRNISKADHFLVNLSKEVSLRLQGCGLQGRTITLKVKTRRKGAGEPIKFMGCGDCETMSRSTTITGATDNLVTLQRIARQLFAAFHVGTNELRNLGSSRPSFTCVASHSSKANLTIDRSTRVDAIELPPLSELDLEVLKNLPPEIISEMNVMYKGELRGFLEMISGDEGKESNSKSLVSPAVDQNSVPACNVKLHGYGEHRDSVHLGKQKDIKGTTDQEAEAASASCSRACELGDTNSVTRLDFMPNSLSQADFTVLQELPEDVKADLFNVLPLHRSRDPTCSTSNVTESKSPNDEGTDDPIRHLPGSSKKWAEQSKISNSLILNAIAEQHADSISNKPLSSILEPIASLLPLCPNSGSEEWNDTLSCLSGLLIEYIHLKVDSDIEELHRCFLLLKR